MSSLEEVAALLRSVADDIPLAALDAAADQLEQAATLLTAIVEGSADDNLHEAAAGLQSAHRQAIDIVGHCTTAARMIRAVADRLAEGASTRDAGRRAQPTSSYRSASPDAQQRHPDLASRIERARADLGPGVAGRRTEGRWIRSDGETVPIESGSRDRWFKRALELVSSHPDARRARRVTTHLEVQMAVRMRDEGRSHETIVIDREVCGRREFDKNQLYTCDNMLKWFLPHGATLTVVQYDGTSITYTGDEDR